MQQDEACAASYNDSNLRLSMSRSGCHGSAESSYDALLPLLTLLPPTLGLNMELMADLLSAVLSGWTALFSAGPATSGKAKQAAAACYTECWFYILAKVPLPNFSKLKGRHLHTWWCRKMSCEEINGFECKLQLH